MKYKRHRFAVHPGPPNFSVDQLGSAFRTNFRRGTRSRSSQPSFARMRNGLTYNLNREFLFILDLQRAPHLQHAEQSLNGYDIPSRTERSGLSTVSSFTRAPTSSIHPDGSTAWVHPQIASYLFSNTPSNEQYIVGEDMFTHRRWDAASISCRYRSPLTSLPNVILISRFG
jgi:hypothetical protein